jgi:hypothetical protein
MLTAKISDLEMESTDSSPHQSIVNDLIFDKRDMKGSISAIEWGKRASNKVIQEGSAQEK